jgi:hypothetical protein
MGAIGRPFSWSECSVLGEHADACKGRGKRLLVELGYEESQGTTPSEKRKYYVRRRPLASSAGSNRTGSDSCTLNRRDISTPPPGERACMASSA